MAEALETLDAENREAWSLFPKLYCRFAADIPGVAGPVIARVLADREASEATDLLERLDLVYSLLVPPKTHST